MSMIKIAFDLGVALARNEASFTKQAAPDLGQFVDKLNNDQSSGLSEVPFLTHGFHKAFTGRYSKPAATLAGVAAGGAGLGLTGAVTNPSPKKERWT